MPRKPRRTNARRLAVDAYLSHALHKYGGRDAFAKLALKEYYDPIKQLGDWRRHDISRKSTSAIEATAPGTEWVRWHPLFPLLEPHTLSARSVRAFLACYEFDGDYDCFECNLPGDPLSRERYDRALKWSFDEFLALVARGDLHGYAMVVAAFRLAGLARDGGVQLFAAASLIHGLALLEHIPWLRPHRMSLRALIFRLLELRTWDGPGMTIDPLALDRLSENGDWQYWLEVVTKRAGPNNPVVFYAACPERQIVSHAKLRPSHERGAAE